MLTHWFFQLGQTVRWSIISATSRHIRQPASRLATVAIVLICFPICSGMAEFGARQNELAVLEPIELASILVLAPHCTMVSCSSKPIPYLSAAGTVPGG